MKTFFHLCWPTNCEVAHHWDRLHATRQSSRLTMVHFCHPFVFSDYHTVKILVGRLDNAGVAWTLFWSICSFCTKKKQPDCTTKTKCSSSVHEHPLTKTMQKMNPSHEVLACKERKVFVREGLKILNVWVAVIFANCWQICVVKRHCHIAQHAFVFFHLCQPQTDFASKAFQKELFNPLSSANGAGFLNHLGPLKAMTEVAAMGCH